jgi:hypothetical protein
MRAEIHSANDHAYKGDTKGKTFRVWDDHLTVTIERGSAAKYAEGDTVHLLVQASGYRDESDIESNTSKLTLRLRPAEVNQIVTAALEANLVHAETVQLLRHAAESLNQALALLAPK